MFDSGILPIVATVSPNESSRNFARSLFKEDEFLLVHIDASIETCIKRDPKNLYSNQAKKIKNITGLHSNYDIPKNADLVLDTEKVGFSVTVFLGIKLARKGQVHLEDFERAVTAIPEVQTVEHVLGVYDYRIRIVARDIPDFERILRRRIMTLPGAGEIEANVLLSEEKRQGPV